MKSTGGNKDLSRGVRAGYLATCTREILNTNSLSSVKKDPRHSCVRKEVVVGAIDSWIVVVSLCRTSGPGSCIDGEWLVKNSSVFSCVGVEPWLHANMQGSIVNRTYQRLGTLCETYQGVMDCVVSS